MPTIMFTAEEVGSSLLDAMRDYSEQIAELADLDRKPLDPGESPDSRRHKIASLGKKLAEVCLGLDELIKRVSAGRGGAAEPAPETPPDPNHSQAN